MEPGLTKTITIMYKKRNYFLLAFFMMVLTCVGITSCSSDDDSTTTYSLKWSFSTSYIDDVTLFEYAENGDKVANHSVDNVVENGTYNFTASDRAAKVKVYFKMGSSPKWVQQVFYLKSGGNTIIEVTGQSIIGSKEP